MLHPYHQNILRAVSTRLDSTRLNERQMLRSKLKETYLGKEQSWGCHLQFWNIVSRLPFLAHVTWAVMNSHFSSLYSGLVALSKTHFPFDKSHDFGGNSIPPSSVDSSLDDDDGSMITAWSRVSFLIDSRTVSWSMLFLSWGKMGSFSWVIWAVKIMSLVSSTRARREREMRERMRGEVLHFLWE